MMDIAPSLVAQDEAAKPVDPGEGALDDTPVLSLVLTPRRAMRAATCDGGRPAGTADGHKPCQRGACLAGAVAGPSRRELEG